MYFMSALYYDSIYKMYGNRGEVVWDNDFNLCIRFDFKILTVFPAWVIGNTKYF